MAADDPDTPKTPSPDHETGSLPSSGELAGLFGDYEHPERIGPYKILQVLGEGGMGVVYLAEQTEPVHRRVALKVIKLGMDTKEVLARFEAERQALAMMNHPNIARVHDVGATEEGRSFFAMEFVQGVPITEYCDRHKLSVKERLELFLQVCQGVLHAHQKGIIHRDIKPANILVSAPDDTPVAKIIDFGVAKATNQRLTEKTIYTEIGRAVGTPAYMSPEQAELTSEDVDHRTDIYSLGVSLYELLVGEQPLDLNVHAVAFDEIVRRIREQEPPAPSTCWSRLNVARTTKLAAERHTTPAELGSQLRRDLDWIVMKAIEKERGRRYETASYLRDDIERYLKSEPVLARPPSAIYRIKKFARKNRGPVTATCAVVLALLAGIVVSLVFYAKSEKNARLATTQANENARLARVATENEAKARAQAEENLALADLTRLDQYRTEARRVWPSSPESIETVNQWLQKVGRFAARIEKHQRNLTELREQALPDEEKSTPGKQSERSDRRTWRFADVETEQRHEMLTILVRGLQEFNNPDPEKGTLAAIKRRLELAPTKEEYEKRRQEAIGSIGDREECPMYKGLEVKLVEGLYPIGRDPESKLWEFVHLRTGCVPKRAEDDSLMLTKETGLVLVLIPGGKFLMGAEKPNEEKPEGSPNVDPFAQDSEDPIHEVTLSAFFIGKYEVRQCEWVRVMTENPSGHMSDSHPVEGVSWYDCKEFSEKLGLTLPSEAQWEYACRARTTSPYAGPGNLDEMGYYFENSGGKTHSVGEKQPNQFGLYDMHGNVWEWCEDAYDKAYYSNPEAAGPDPVNTSASEDRVLRGCSWGDNAQNGRSSFRFARPGSFRDPFIGFRVARPCP